MAEVRQERGKTTWYELAQAYMEMKWPRSAAKSRRSTVEGLTAVTVMLVGKGGRGRPDATTLREAVYRYGLDPRRKSTPTPEHAASLAWLEKASLPVAELESLPTVRRVLDGLCVRLDGKPGVPDRQAKHPP